MGRWAVGEASVQAEEFRQPFDGRRIYNGQIWEFLTQPKPVRFGYELIVAS